MDRTRQALARLHRSPGVVALLFIDLDRFKAVNDNLGHEVGDKLLIAVSKRLEELMRDSDTVARLGGDEFVILAEEIVSDGEALALAERVLHAMENAFQLGTAESRCWRASAYPFHTIPKATPRACCARPTSRCTEPRERAAVAWNCSMRSFAAKSAPTSRSRAACVTRCRGDELLLAYQPIMPLAGGHAVGCEALVRWQPRAADQSKTGQLLPSTFLPRAAESELIVEIGDWVLHTACAQAAIWHREGIADPDLREHLRARADRARSRPARAERAQDSRLPGSRAVPRGERGGRPARPRARARGAQRRQAPRRRARA